MATLQEQVNAAISGAVIQHDTEFVGNLIIDKPLTIQGSGKVRTPNADPAIDIVPKTGPVTLKGLEILTTPGWALTYMIVRMGAWQTTEIIDVPQGLTIDSCNIHGQPGQDLQQGVAANGANVTIRNSRIWEIHHRGADSQALAAWNGPGPFIIEDNYLEASGENIMFGGAEVKIQNLVPSNIQIRRNHLFKPLSWRQGDPSYAGIPWAVKNLLELKNARNVVIEGNVLENNWVMAQSGYAVLFTLRTEDGKNPWNTVENVVFKSNTIKNVPAGFQLIGKDSVNSLQASGLIISNNLIQFGAGLGTNGRLVQMQQYNNVVFENNEADPPHTHLVMSGQDSSGLPLTNLGLIYRNNLVSFGEYGVFCDSDQPYKVYAPDGVITGNYVYGPNIPAARIIPNNSYFDAKPTSIPVGTGVDYVALKAAQSAIVTTPIPAPSPTPVPAPTPTPAPIPAPIKYIYESRSWPNNTASRLKLLNDMGAQGWRHAGVVSSIAYFEKS